MSKKNRLDQYYTKSEVANKLLDIFLSKGECKGLPLVEPSAGKGSFMREDIDWEAYDLEPRREGVIAKDFLEVQDLEGKFLVGNPPFGFKSSLALKFINHSFDRGAAKVGFILPRTFKKTLFQDKVTLSACLTYQEDVEDHAFILNGESYHVPCVFQIWERGSRVKKTFKNFFTKGSPADYDFIIKRVGGRAGKIISKSDFTTSSSLYVKGDKDLFNKYRDEILKEATYTAGVRSITLNEINLIVTENEGKACGKENPF